MGFKLYGVLLVLICAGLPILLTAESQTYRYVKHSPPIEEVYFKDIGPMQCRQNICMPQFETMCLRTTQQCRFVNHPWENRFLVQVCRDPHAPGGLVFFTAADRYCLAHV